jgi:hypothetical protein
MTHVAVPSLYRRAILISLLVCSGVGLLVVPGAAAGSACRGGPATAAQVGRPSPQIAWRAGLFGATPVYDGAPGARMYRGGWVRPDQASWLLVLAADRDVDGRCWVEVRLPTRPNSAKGWLRADEVLLKSTDWSIAISRAARTLTLFRRGIGVMRASVVVGKPTTPTPTGLFSIIGAWPSPPNAFDGSWVLPLTAHSNVLASFDGGEGTVGIHGRGGTSLVDPLGTALSHGCIRLDNHAIDLLVQLVGAGGLAGIPVHVR